MSHEPRYDLVVALNYYSPYVSGVTEVARVLAEGAAARGYRVLVVAGRHDPSLPRRETINGVDVRRTRVVARFGKGIISPGFVPAVVRAARRARVLHLHLPMLEAGVIALAVRSRTLLTTYQCDVTLPPGVVNRIQERALDLSHAVCLRRSRLIAVTSEDYARSSRLWRWMRGRLVTMPGPALVRAGGSPAYRSGPGLHVGFLGRIVAEKGLEYLVDGFRTAAGEQDRLLIGGDFTKVAGGSVVDAVRKRIEDDPRISLLGFLPTNRLADFYASLDLFAFPSVNSLEAFGLVQVEAMMVGVPVIASDLPGVRMPVRDTGFGVIVPPRDAPAIAAAIDVLRDRDFDRAAQAEQARSRYAADAILESYCELLNRLGSRPETEPGGGPPA